MVADCYTRITRIPSDVAERLQPHSIGYNDLAASPFGARSLWRFETARMACWADYQEVFVVQSNPSFVSFSTAHLSRGESVAAWREYLAEIYCRQDVRPLGTDYISGNISKRSVGEIAASKFVSGGAQRVVRTKELAKTDPSENFHFVFPSAGTFLYQQGRRDCRSGKGDSFILNASSSFKIDFSDDAKSYVLVVPCDTIRKRIVGIDDFISKERPFDPLLVSVISNITLSLVDMESKISECILQEICIDLLVAAVADARLQDDVIFGSSISDHLIIERIITTIDKEYVDPNFSLPNLSRFCRVSPRQIQKILSKRQTTFSRELLNTRLAKAAHLLKTRGRSIATIGNIAKECGFVNQSHFSNCYRQRFGLTPREDQQGYRSPTS